MSRAKRCDDMNPDDVLQLMVVARREVAENFGVMLEAEQHLLGFGEQTPNSLLDQLAEEEL